MRPTNAAKIRRRRCTRQNERLEANESSIGLVDGSRYAAVTNHPVLQFRGGKNRAPPTITSTIRARDHTPLPRSRASVRMTGTVHIQPARVGKCVRYWHACRRLQTSASGPLRGTFGVRAAVREAERPEVTRMLDCLPLMRGCYAREAFSAAFASLGGNGRSRSAHGGYRLSLSVIRAPRAGSIVGPPAAAHDRPQSGEAATMRHTGGECLMR